MVGLIKSGTLLLFGRSFYKIFKGEKTLNFTHVKLAALRYQSDDNSNKEKNIELKILRKCINDLKFEYTLLGGMTGCLTGVGCVPGMMLIGAFANDSGGMSDGAFMAFYMAFCAAPVVLGTIGGAGVGRLSAYFRLSGYNEFCNEIASDLPKNNNDIQES